MSPPPPRPTAMLYIGTDEEAEAEAVAFMFEEKGEEENRGKGGGGRRKVVFASFPRRRDQKKISYGRGKGQRRREIVADFLSNVIFLKVSDILHAISPVVLFVLVSKICRISYLASCCSVFGRQAGASIWLVSVPLLPCMGTWIAAAANVGNL